MPVNDLLLEQFEANRARLRGLGYRMLGSAAEAEDVVQEAWLRLHRAQAADGAKDRGQDGAKDGVKDIDNLSAWLTTTVSRLCLDQLRARRSRREDALEEGPSVSRKAAASARMDPEEEAELADSIGLAMLVILDRLAPAERLAFVLHDTFALTFEAIATILGRSPTACRQLASRARRRVRGGPPAASSASARDFETRRRAVEAFSAAAQAGDVAALLAVLDPEAEFHAAGEPLPPGAARERHGALNIAKGAAYGARVNAGTAAVVLIDGEPGIISAPNGQLRAAARFGFREGKIKEITLLVSPADLRRLDLALLEP